MPKVTKRKASKNDAPTQISEDNESLNEEEQPVITTVESKSKKGVKRKASSSVEKVNKSIESNIFCLLLFGF